MMTWNLPQSYDFFGREVRYGIAGTGPPVVCVHGTPWSSFNLRKLIERLAGACTVYYYDLLGYGQSSRVSGDVSLGIQNEVLDRLLDHWGLERSVAVGHDFGGATVLRTHLLNRRLFEKIVLIDPVALSPWGSPFFRHVREHEEAFANVPDYIHDAIVRAYVKTAAFGALDDATLDNIVAPWTGSEGKAAFYRQIAQADSRYTDEIQELYGGISVPVLLLWGREDLWIPREQGTVLAGLIPGATLKIIDDAGHLVIEEKPEQLVTQIEAFINMAA